MDKLLLTRNEAAVALSLSTRSIDYLVSIGKLASRKFGKRRLIPRDAVERLAKQGCDRIVPVQEADERE